MKSAVHLPLKLRILCAVYRFILKLTRRKDGSINRTLLNLIEIKTPPSKTPKDGIVSSDTIIDPIKNLWFRLFLPTTKSGGDGGGMSLIVYYHGGGFALSSPNLFAYDNYCRKLAKQLQAAVVSVNYRLAPEYRYPTQYEDGFDALKYLDANLESLPPEVNPKLCFLAGDSAGGNLAHHMAVESGGCEFSRVRIIGLLAIQPFFGGEERVVSEVQNPGWPLLSLVDTDWYWNAFLPNGSNRDHAAANVFGPNSTVDIARVKYPATLVLLGGLDILNDWQRRYYNWLKDAGKEVELVEHPFAFHGSYVFDELPEYSFYVDRIQEFVSERIEKEKQL